MAAPDLADDDLCLAGFALEDLVIALEAITSTIRAIRKKPHWTKDELVMLKTFRAILHPYLDKARRDSLTPAEHKVLQEHLNRAAALTG